MLATSLLSKKREIQGSEVAMAVAMACRTMEEFDKFSSEEKARFAHLVMLCLFDEDLIRLNQKEANKTMSLISMIHDAIEQLNKDEEEDHE